MGLGISPVSALITCINATNRERILNSLSRARILTRNDTKVSIPFAKGGESDEELKSIAIAALKQIFESGELRFFPKKSRVKIDDVEKTLRANGVKIMGLSRSQVAIINREGGYAPKEEATQEKPIDIFAEHGIDPKDGCDFAKPRIDVSNALSSPVGDPAVKEVFRWWRSKIWNARKNEISTMKWAPRGEGILIHPSTELVDCAQNRDVALRVLCEHGYEKGLPDLILISPQCGGPGFRIRLGLALEIKKHGDELSLSQDWMLKKFERNWFVSKIAHGADHAIAIIDAYMRGEDELP